MRKISGAYLKELRIEHGYSLRGLADVLYVSKSTIDNWEKKDSLTDKNIINALADLYGIDAAELISHTAVKAAEPLFENAIADTEIAEEAASDIVIAQSEPQEPERAEASAEKSAVRKSNTKLFKILVSVIAGVIGLALVVGICILGIVVFSGNEGYATGVMNDWNPRPVELFITLVVVLLCAILVSIVIWVWIRRRKKKKIRNDEENSKE